MEPGKGLSHGLGSDSEESEPPTESFAGAVVSWEASQPATHPAQWLVACMQHLKGAAHSLCHGFRQMQVARLKLLHRNYFLALHRDTWHLVVTDKQMKLLFTPCSLLDLKEVGFPNYE